MSTKADYRIVIPARAASERLPGKPLQDICGQTLLQRVWSCAGKSSATEIIIATDDQQIQKAAKAFGARALMTDSNHNSGSDRIAECMEQLSWPDDTVVVNLQGDEPEMPATCLDQVANMLMAHPDADAASLYQSISCEKEISDSNAVKVVVDEQGRALYFSRAVIPAVRGHDSIESAVKAGQSWKRHIGLYAYRAGALRHFTSLPPSPLEKSERLEQLRILESGGFIVMAHALVPVPAGVDTPEDLERVRRAFQ
ncbi:MAG TPA: 3-deoxy-manno-octulosonate cytidylyltransferase [Xanthomonadales bacterium]|nr:3-deoxy-manno-octulosonate cytidylyltransferase [Xanthomonadales bacterium]